MKVYTSIENLKIGNQKFNSYKELSQDFIEWADETAIKLLIDRNEDELKAVEELSKLKRPFHVQPFFRIDGNCYFPDVFFPDFALIIEIDGGYHALCKKQDMNRDILFKKIGINTIRIPSRKVRSGETLIFLHDAIENGKYSVVKKKKRRKKKLLNKTQKK